MARISSRGILLALVLSACARAPVVIHPIVDLPARPLLPHCVEANAQGHVLGQEVIFDIAAIEAFREGLKEERVCYAEREALLEGWGSKILNRLKAVIQP